MPTVMANLQLAGVEPTIAKGVQALAVVAVAIVVTRCFRRTPGPLAVAALLVGTFLATPHARVYDLPMVTAALALFIEQRMQTTTAFSVGEVLILLLAFAFPLAMATAVGSLPVSTVPLTLLFCLILRRAGPGRPVVLASAI